MSVGVLFELRVGETLPGETVCISGDRPELGAWDAGASVEASPLRLSTSPISYPRWLARGPIWFQVGAPGDVGGTFTFQYKFVKVSAKERRIHWEDTVTNRCVELPCEDGRIWIVSAAKWDSCAEQTLVCRANAEELRAWRAGLDPTWTPHCNSPQAISHQSFSMSAEPHECVINSPRDEQPQVRRRGDETIEEQYRALSPQRALPLLGFWASQDGADAAPARRLSPAPSCKSIDRIPEPMSARPRRVRSTSMRAAVTEPLSSVAVRKAGRTSSKQVERPESREAGQATSRQRHRRPASEQPGSHLHIAPASASRGPSVIPIGVSAPPTPAGGSMGKLQIENAILREQLQQLRKAVTCSDARRRSPQAKPASKPVSRFGPSSRHVRRTSPMMPTVSLDRQKSPKPLARVANRLGSSPSPVRPPTMAAPADTKDASPGEAPALRVARSRQQSPRAELAKRVGPHRSGSTRARPSRQVAEPQGPVMSGEEADADSPDDGPSEACGPQADTPSFIS